MWSSGNRDTRQCLLGGLAQLSACSGYVWLLGSEENCHLFAFADNSRRQRETTDCCARAAGGATHAPKDAFVLT